MSHEVKAQISQVEEAERLAAGRTSAHLVLECCGVGLFLGWTTIIASSVHQRLSEDDAIPITAYRMFVAAVLGILVADLTSGVLHWAVDNWGEPDFPILGSTFFRAFHHHHADPHAITTHGFIETNGNNFFSSLPLLWAAAYTIRGANSKLSLLYASFWLSYALCSGFANQIHSWAHMKNPPTFVRELQDFGLLVSRRHHQIHHIRPHDRNYCLVTGWMNRPLTAINFFETIEMAITMLGGARPLHARI